MSCITPFRGDSAQLLLFKIANCLAEGGGGGGGGGGVTSFNTRTGAITLTSGDVTTALGFTPLSQTSGDARYVLKAGDTMTGALAHSVGAAATPSITFAGDLNSGLYSAGADAIGISVNGASAINISPAETRVHTTFATEDITGLCNGGFSIFPAVAFVQPIWFGGSGNLADITIFGFDGSFDPLPNFRFVSGGVGAAQIGFFSDVAQVPVGQQSAPGNTLPEVLAALRAYGLLAP